MNLSKFFIDRPIFAGVLSVLIFLAGLLALRVLPISEYPEVVPPSVVVRAQYPGANPKVIAETVATPIEEAINGVEGMLYMSSQATTDGLMTLTVTFRLGTDPDKAQQLVQNRVVAGRAAPARGSAAPRRHHGQELARPDDGRAPAVAERPLRHDLPAQLRGAERQGPAGAHRRRRPGAAVRRRATIRCASGSTRRRSPSAACRPATSCARSARRTCRPRPASSARRPACPGVDLQLSINAQGRLQTEEEFGDIIVKTGANGEVTRLRDVARIELGASEYALRSLLDNKPAVADRRSSRRRARTPSQISDNVRARHGRAEEEHAGGRRLRDRLRPDAVRARLDRGGGAHAARSGRAGRAGGHPVPADLARLDHSAAGRAGVDHRHVRGDARVRLLDQRADACSAWCWRSASWSTTPSSWSRTSSATSRTGLSPREATYQRHARGVRPDHRHRAGADRGVRAARLHQRPDRAVLQAVRADHRDLDRDLGDQLADAVAGARRAAAQGARRAEGLR